MTWYRYPVGRVPAVRDAEPPVKAARGSGRANPHAYLSGNAGAMARVHQRQMAFFSADSGRLLSGWESSTNRVDFYLQSELWNLRARSRAAVRKGPYGKRYLRLMCTNIVGARGVQVKPMVMRGTVRDRQPDTLANSSIAEAWADWCKYHCDYKGLRNFVALQKLAVATATQDGEYIFRMHFGPSAGKYGFQLEVIDPEILDTTKNEATKNGEIRLGVEYDAAGRVVRYHFRDVYPNGVSSGYTAGRTYSVDAAYILHGYLAEWPDQSRGIPWMHASLERMKHLDKYEEAAIVKARGSAAVFGVMRSKGDDTYQGSEDAPGYNDGTTLDTYEPGTIHDIGDREFHNVDSSYPHQMYAAFVKTCLQAISSGLNISYHTLANDLEGVNYSSARAGILEDREVFKELQRWFIDGLITPVYEHWVEMAILTGGVTIGGRRPGRAADEYKPAHYQGRRWAWVDPQKDGQSNALAVENRTRSRSSIIRDQGEDPAEVFAEIAEENDAMSALGIAPLAPVAPASDNPDDEEADDDG